jgi:hypothetical protein
VADTICRTAEIGLTITGAADAGNLTIIDAAPVTVSDACSGCSQPGTKRDHTIRRLVDLPVVGFHPSARPRPPFHLQQCVLCQNDLPGVPQLRR